MKQFVRNMIKVFKYSVFIAAFLVVSCAEVNDEQTTAVMKTGKTYNERLAKQTYDHYCAACHGIEGKGDGFNAINLEQAPPDFTDAEYMNLLTHEYLVQAISVGGQAINKSPLMPAWKHTLSPDDIQRLARYVNNFAIESQAK
jgi:mono/diheme cytochrome c family protein